MQYLIHRFQMHTDYFLINYTYLFYLQNYYRSSMSAQYSKGKVDVIETKTGPKNARYKTTSNVEKFKTRLTESSWRWTMFICVIAIVVAILVVPIVVTVTVYSNGDLTGIRFLYFKRFWVILSTTANAWHHHRIALILQPHGYEQPYTIYYSYTHIQVYPFINNLLIAGTCKIL